MRRSLIVGLVLGILSPGSGSSSVGPPVELQVYAAASLRDALLALAPACERAAGARLVFNFSASNDLARQIEAAGKADVFVSADEDWMDRLDRAGLVDRASRRVLVSNRLVVVGEGGGALRVTGPADLAGAGVRRLSLANPEAVPAGRYARTWLERSGWWEAVRDRIVPALDARAALAAVEAGAAEAGVVYRTDALASRRVRILFEVPASDGPRISYPAAALLGRPHLETARRVVAWLAAPEAAVTFERLGFLVERRSEARPSH
jgi:molybdate transport system substrate-binding protein